MKSWTVVMLGAWLSLGCSACGEKPAPAQAAKAEQPTARRVRFDEAALTRLGVKSAPAGTDLAEGLSFPGVLEYDVERYAEVGTPIEGRVASLDARPGDKVKKGQRLATVRVPSLASAQADVVTARAVSQVASDHARRESSLLEQKLTTARESEVAHGEEIKGKAELAAAKARLEALGITANVTDVVEGAGTLTLKAPLAGVVVRRDAALGTFLEPHETAFIVADPSKLWATIQVYEFDMRFVQVGSEAKITIDAFPGRSLSGKVALIEPELGSVTRALRARIAIDNTDDALRAGLFVRASVAIPAGGDALLLPVGAVQPVGDEDVVFVRREAGVYEMRPVRIARRGPQLVEIASGVVRGETIVTEGAFVLRAELSKQ